MSAAPDITIPSWSGKQSSAEWVSEPPSGSELCSGRVGFQEGRPRPPGACKKHFHAEVGLCHPRAETLGVPPEKVRTYCSGTLGPPGLSELRSKPKRKDSKRSEPLPQLCEKGQAQK
eukprot:6472055-Amphidinium_carterae.1